MCSSDWSSDVCSSDLSLSLPPLHLFSLFPSHPIPPHPTLSHFLLSLPLSSPSSLLPLSPPFSLPPSCFSLPPTPHPFTHPPLSFSLSLRVGHPKRDSVRRVWPSRMWAPGTQPSSPQALLRAGTAPAIQQQHAAHLPGEAVCIDLVSTVSWPGIKPLVHHQGIG